MRFQWIHYLFLSEKLRDGLSAQPSGEAIQAVIRCSISRAYYAAHWHSRNYLETNFKSFITGRHEVHKTVVQKMLAEDGELAKIGDQLERLRWERVRADYDSSVAFSKIDCDSVLLQANDIIDRINKLP